MHYQHRFHAGNFADVFKHVLLTGLFRALNRKDKAWCYLDTHAGAGSYDLADEAAGRTDEYRNGISRLWNAQTPPEMVGDFLARVRARNPEGELRHYPGSPLLAASFARAGDRLLLCERVPEIAELLRQQVGGDDRAHVHVRDGYEAVSLLPPVEKRGLILVDPPFERPDEFEQCGRFLQRGVQRFGNGVFAVWYPYKNRFQTERWLRRVQRECPREALNFVLHNGASGEGQMRTCGLLVINPPFSFVAEAREALFWLKPRLSQGPDATIDIDPWPAGGAQA